MSLTERIYGKETAGKPAVSSDTRKNLYTAAANKKPSLANRIAQNGGQPTLYADAAAKQKPSLASRIEANGGTPYADAAAQMKSGNAAKGTSVVFNSVYGKADDRASSAGSGKYAGILKASDYTELSKSGESKRKLFGDARYDYINNIGNFRAQSDVQQAQGRGQDYGKYAFMTDDEIGVYNYLYATQGKKAANAYLSDLEPELDKQWYTGTNRATTEALGKNAATRTLASAMTVAAQPTRTITSMIAMADDAVRTAKGQEINPYSKWRQASNITQELRADTSQHIEETNPGMGGKVGSFVYNTAMSAADSAMNALVAKGIGEAVGLTGDTLMKATNILGSALMSSEAASLSIAESKEKGYSNAGALALGLTRGAIEYASEAVGGEWVIRKIKANPLSFVKSMALTMIPEGMEEVMSDAANGVVNLAIDAAFGTEESGIPKMLEYYRTSGTDWQKKHAELATVLAVLGQEGLSFLGGALATLGSSSVQYSTNRANINQTAERLDTTPKNVVQMMQDAQTEDPGVIYALAELTDAENADDLRQKIGTKEDMKRAAEYLTQQMEVGGRSGAQEGVYTAGAQNAPVGAQRAQNEGISTTPAAAINIQEGMNNGQSTYQGRENGSYDLRTGGQAAAEGGAQALAGGRAEIPGGVGADAQADLRQVTPAQLGIRNGGTEAVTVVDARKLGGDAARAYNLLAANNIEPVAVRGAIQVNNGYANAYTESGRVFFRVDAVDSRGNAISPEALVRHELFHNYISEEVLQASDEVIRESMTAEEYDAMYESYRDAYASIYDFENMSEDEIERLLTEEIAADAYAGLNWFSGDAPVQEAVRAETERNAPARRAEAQQETTGPPEGRGTIVVLPDGKKYVQADRQVIFGDDPDSWADQIEGYINRKIRNGEDVILTTDSGDVLKITKDTAGKASFRNYVTDENGHRRLMTDSEYEAKLNAEAHIDELIQVSEKKNNTPVPDELGTNGKPLHGGFAKNGWFYRKAWFQDFDGKYYLVTISTADGDNGVVVYNVGDMKRRGSPANIHGSSDSVTETGAQQGKSSSTVTIRQTEGNSQEKSSGRASAAGIRARTADNAALQRAEALEKSGTDNETIRQETGWYRGMDGQWRFEIDDSGAAFSRSGEAQYSADNADYARYTQLMNRMLTGDLTEAEHAELLGLDKKNGSTKKELARRIDEGNATLRDIMQHNALFEAYPEIAETKVKFADMPSGMAGSYNRETNTIMLDTKLKYDANEALDALMHEVQHRVQAAEGFASGTNPGYWNRGENYDRAAEKYRDNRARLLNGLSADERALYNEYRSVDQEMGRMLDGSALYDEGRMDTLEKRSDELYKELYSKEWFGKLSRYDRILGDAGEAVKEFYRNTAGEIEARDTAARRRMSAEERKNTPPDLGDADTVFADGNGVSTYVDVDADGNPVTVVQTDKDVFDNANRSQYAAIAQRIIKSKYAGQTLPLGESDLARIAKKSAGEYAFPRNRLPTNSREYDAKMRASAELHNLLENSTYDHWAPDAKNHKEATLGFDYYKTVFAVNGKIFEGLVNVANSENGRVFYDITKIREVPDTYGKYAALLARSSSVFGNLSEDNIRSAEGKSQEKSSGRASVEVSGINREMERLRARENIGAGQRFVPNKSSGEVYRDLMGKGKSEVKVQMTGFLKGTPKESTFKVEVKPTPIGGYYEATIFRDGHKADTLVRALKETAARDAAEEVITMANKNFSEENYQRAKKFEAEKTADEDARIAELFGDPEQLDGTETSPKSSDAAETENTAAGTTIAATTEKVTSEVIKAERNFREDFEKITSGAMRMFVNAGDTVRRIAKATGSKSLEGYYFNAGAYSQRAGNWIAKGGARTDIDGHRIGASLADTLAPMRKNETKYRDFQLYLLHMHNVDRMKYDNSGELERIKENLRWVKEKYPELRELSNEELRRIANSDSDSPVVRQAAHEIYLAAHNGEAPSLTSVAEGAAYALELERQRAIVEKQGLKPVFGYDVTADDSQTAAQLLEAKNPEFKEWAKEVYKYSDDLIRYRVEAGLITPEFANALKKRYPHYIPTFREEGTNSKRARSARRNGGIVVSNAIGRAVGSDGVLLPLHTALSRKTVSTMRNAGLNQFGLALVREYDRNAKAAEKYIWNVAESEYTPTEAAIESDEDYKPVFENVFSVKDNGRAYDITMDEGLTAAMKAFEPDKFASYGAAKAMKKLNDLFKALCTGYNPFFMIRNGVRDWQDAGFYSTDWKTWEKMYWSAWNQIRKNGEIWQQYKALGGSYASMLDYTTGMVKEPKNALGKAAARYERLGQAIEAAPRLAEFMTILANKGGSKTVDGVKTGQFTQSDLMEAMLGAADITTNFARGGSATKALNRYLVPFLNPSIQGFDKFIRNATETRSVKAAASLILKAALINLPPLLLNGLMHGDDDDWDDIPANTKANYYLINAGKLFGNGYWIKIPKGRAIAVLSTAAVYTQEKQKGEDVKFSDVFEVIKSNIAPTDIFNQNIATAWTQAKLTNPDNPGTTWYGGNIESDRLQNYRPEDRYDEKTDELSKAIGKLFKVSPKKVNYLLDQYTGVIGDLLLPLITPATKSSHWLLAAPQAAFTIDTTSTNKTTGEYYDLLDDLKYDANDGDIGAGITRKYVSHAGDEVNDYYQQIRAIQNDKSLSDGEKNRIVRALKAQLIERQKEIIAQAEPYREAVSDYLKAHPELSTDNDAAIAEYAELYGITEDQAESRMDAIVYREANREVFGAEYALRTYNADVYDKARAAYAKGVSYDTYYDYYFATKEMHADKDENGKSISGSKKAKVVEYINSLDIPPEQKDALYVAAGYTAKSARNQKWNGGSGGSGGRRGRGKRTALKAPTPKAPEIIIPKSGTASSAKAGGTSKTPKVSGNVIADFTKTASGTDIQKAVTQAKRKALKAGNRTVYVEEGSPIDYFLKYGKLPSLK